MTTQIIRHRKTILATACLTALFLSSLFALRVTLARQADSDSTRTADTTDAVRSAPRLTGLRPARLASIGATDTDLAALDTFYADSAERLDAIEADLEIYYEQRTEVARAKQTLQRIGWTADRAAALDRAEKDHETMRVSLVTAQAALRRGALTALGRPEADIARAERVIANRDRPVPEAFKCLNRTDEAWSLIELASRKRAKGVRPSADESAAYNACLTHPDTILVQSRLDAKLADLEAAIRTSRD